MTVSSKANTESSLRGGISNIRPMSGLGMEMGGNRGKVIASTAAARYTGAVGIARVVASNPISTIRTSERRSKSMRVTLEWHHFPLWLANCVP
jgi:hypothetical protein